MKKVISIVILAIMVLFAAACGEKYDIGDIFSEEINTTGDVRMTVDADSVTPEGLTIAVVNEIYNDTITSGNESDFAVQVEVEGEWYSLKSKEKYAINADALLFPRDEEVMLNFDWDYRFGSLPDGHYRVVKKFEVEETGETFWLADDFYIGIQIPEIVEEEHWDVTPSVMVNGQLYCTTGKESTIEARCGMIDGEITSTVEGWEIPTEDNQSNFGTGYGYQYVSEDTIEIYMNDTWWVYEIRE